MSKTDVKKYIKALDREGLEMFVLDVYSAVKEAKKYMDYAINPNDEELLQEAKALLDKEFVGMARRPRMRYTEGRSIIAKFKRIDPSPEMIADLMLFFTEIAVAGHLEYGFFTETGYESLNNTFINAANYILKHKLAKRFMPRIQQLVKDSRSVSSIPYYYQDEFAQRLLEQCSDDSL